jgi:hypothetical protein
MTPPAAPMYAPPSAAPAAPAYAPPPAPPAAPPPPAAPVPPLAPAPPAAPAPSLPRLQPRPSRLRSRQHFRRLLRRTALPHRHRLPHRPSPSRLRLPRRPRRPRRRLPPHPWLPNRFGPWRIRWHQRRRSPRAWMKQKSSSPRCRLKWMRAVLHPNRRGPQQHRGRHRGHPPPRPHGPLPLRPRFLRSSRRSKTKHHRLAKRQRHGPRHRAGATGGSPERSGGRRIETGEIADDSSGREAAKPAAEKKVPGKILWQFPKQIPGQAYSTTPLRGCPVAYGKTQFAACLGKMLVGLDWKGSGLEKIWECEVGGHVPGSPTLGADGLIRVHSGDGWLHCVDQNGFRVWEPVPVGEPLGWAAPIVDLNNLTYVSGYAGGIFRVGARGEFKNRAFLRTRQKFDSTGLIYRGMLYIGCEDAFLYAIPISEDEGRNGWNQLEDRGRTQWFINSAPAWLAIPPSSSPDATRTCTPSIPTAGRPGNCISPARCWPPRWLAPTETSSLGSASSAPAIATRENWSASMATRTACAGSTKRGGRSSPRRWSGTIRLSTSATMPDSSMRCAPMASAVASASPLAGAFGGEHRRPQSAGFRLGQRHNGWDIYAHREGFPRRAGPNIWLVEPFPSTIRGQQRLR